MIYIIKIDIQKECTESFIANTINKYKSVLVNEPVYITAHIGESVEEICIVQKELAKQITDVGKQMLEEIIGVYDSNILVICLGVTVNDLTFKQSHVDISDCAVVINKDCAEVEINSAYVETLSIVGNLKHKIVINEELLKQDREEVASHIYTIKESKIK